MRILDFNVNGQNLEKSKKCDFSGITPGTDGELYARFKMSSDWRGRKVAAAFFSNGKESAMPVLNGMCEIPAEVLTGVHFYVQLSGAKTGKPVQKTNKVIVVQGGKKI